MSGLILPAHVRRETVTPHEYLRRRLDPLGAEMDAMRARGLLIGFMPQAGAIHVVYRCNSDEDRCDLLAQVASELTSRSLPDQTLWTPSGDVVLAQGMPTRARFKPSEWLKLRLDPIAAEAIHLGAQALIAGVLIPEAHVGAEGFEVAGSEAKNPTTLAHLANILRAESHRHRAPGKGIQVPPNAVREGAM